MSVRRFVRTYADPQEWGVVVVELWEDDCVIHAQRFNLSSVDESVRLGQYVEEHTTCLQVRRKGVA